MALASEPKTRRIEAVRVEERLCLPPLTSTAAAEARAPRACPHRRARPFAVVRLVDLQHSTSTRPQHHDRHARLSAARAAGCVGFLPHRH